VFYRIIDRSFIFTPIKSLKKALIKKNNLVKETNKLLKLINKKDMLASANNLFINPAILHRRNIKLFAPPGKFEKTDYLILNKDMNLNHIYKPQYKKIALKKLEEFLLNYKILEQTENYVLYKKVN
jgi:hypothetical protein